MLVDSLNVVFVCHMTYYEFTAFGDYQVIQLVPWSAPAVILSASVLEVSVQHFYAHRIYLLGRGSPYLPAAISVLSLTGFVTEIVFGTNILRRLDEPSYTFEDIIFFIAKLACDVLCDVLITFGMVYILLSNRTQFRRTNSVLNLLAIYTINCGTLNSVFAITCIILYTTGKYEDSPKYAPPSLIMIRLYFCAFMAILNSRDNLRETLDGQGDVVSIFSVLSVRTDTIALGGVQVTTESSTDADVAPKSLSPAKLSSGKLISDVVITFDREKYPTPPVPEVMDGMSA